MPLSDDQKAMLRLLAREQSYEDIGALMGLSVDEVVARAEGAVAQLESEGIPAPTLPPAPGAAAPAAPPSTAPAPAAPAAKEPPAPEPQRPEPKAAPTPTPSPAAPRKTAPGKPRDKGLLAAIGGGILAVVVIVVLVVLLISNSDGDGDSTGSAAGGETTVSAGSGSRQPTTASLAAVDGSDATGKAEFGRVKNSLALGIDARGVDPAPQGQIYMVWLAESPQKMLPLTAVAANQAGRINASYQVPTEAVVYLASGEFDRLVITLTENGKLRKALEEANQQKEFPTYTGDPVLEGEIVGPIVGAAKRLEERQK